MGKRELLIILGFLVLGAALYQVTAPPAREGSGFSFRRLIDEIRADIRSDSTSATYTHRAEIDVSPSLEEVRIASVSGQVTVTGEDRSNIAYELEVRSTGPDEATATEYAKRTVLLEDDLGDTLGFRVSYPPEARQMTSLVMRVPNRLRVRLEGGNSRNNTGEFRDLAALRLEGVLGEVTAERISGAISGSHQNGRLTVNEAGSVALTLRSSRALLSGVRDGVKLNATRGETRVVASSGPLEIEQSSNELTIEEHEGSIRVGGSGGQVEIVDPRHSVEIDVQRTDVTLSVSRAVPITVITSDEPIRLQLDGPPSVVVDAIIAGRGDLVADDFGLTPISGQDQTSLTHAFDADATTRIALRNRRDDIVIRKRK